MEVKASIEQPAYQTAYRHLIDEAEQALNSPCLSVMMKEQTAVSGDKHDYLSLSRYFWPDPTKPDGLPILEKAAEFLAQYLGKPVEVWPYQQISEWDYKQNELAKDLYRLYLLDTNHAFAEADVQLRYQLEQANKIRKERNDWSLMPRCVEKDGSLRMVRQPDWCCGFFSGELWQMYQYSHDPFWREQATYVSDDDAKTYRQAADKMLHSLESGYQPEPQTAQGFLLLHSTGNYPAHDEIDVPINYADYYYLEALHRRATMK